MAMNIKHETEERKERTATQNYQKEEKEWVHGGWVTFFSLSNRPVLWILRRVKSSIFVLRSPGKSLSPYNKICSRASFERLVYPSGCDKKEKISSWFFERWAEQQKVLRILNAIVVWAHWVSLLCFVNYTGWVNKSAWCLKNPAPEYQSNDVETVLFYPRYVKLGSVIYLALISHSFPSK